MRGVFRSVQHEKVPHQGEFNGSVPTGGKGVGWDVDWLFFGLLISDMEQVRLGEVTGDTNLFVNEAGNDKTFDRGEVECVVQYSTDWYVGT